MAELDADPVGDAQPPLDNGQADGNPAQYDPHGNADAQEPPRAPSTIADGGEPPNGDDDIEPVFMNARCDPCIDRGRNSRCNKAWPSCSKCVAEGIEEFCFEGARILAANILAAEVAARIPRPPPNRPDSAASRRTPVPPRSSRANSQAPPDTPRRSGSPGRDDRPGRDERVRSPRPRPSATPVPEFIQFPNHDQRVRELMLVVAQAQADLAQAQLNAALAPGHAPAPVLAPALGHIPIPALHAGAITGARTRPAVIPGVVVDSSFASIPEVIWKLIGTAGWVTHIPLTYLTDDFIDNTDEHHKLEEAYHMTPNGKWVRTGGDKLPDRNESGMMPTPWFRAWQRFLGVLTSLGHPDLERWRAHVALIMAQPTFTSDWPLWLSYCIAVRRRSIREGVDPSVLQTEILTALRPEYERSRLRQEKPGI